MNEKTLGTYQQQMVNAQLQAQQLNLQDQIGQVGVMSGVGKLKLNPEPVGCDLCQTNAQEITKLHAEIQTLKDTIAKLRASPRSSKNSTARSKK